MSSGIFRGKESSNRIELSRLVQELLNFGVFGSLQLWGVGGGWMGVGGGWGCGWMGWRWYPHTHPHARACTHTHACVVNMIISCKWPPPLRESLGISYDVICACACCMCAHTGACVWGGTLSPPPPTSTNPPPPKGGPPESVKIQ